MPRLLRLLDRQGIRATFFVPGYSAERWPGDRRAIRDAGHEIAHHGYLHEGAHGASADEQERRLLRGLEALDAVLGVRPVGYRGPMWELTYDTWRSSQARVRVRHRAHGRGPSVPARDVGGAGRARHRRAARPLGARRLGAYNYLPGLTGSGVIASPDEVVGRWTLELEALAEDGGLFMLTNHPFVSGRASRAAALERLIERAKAIDGLWIATAAEIAAHTASLGLEPVVHRGPSSRASGRFERAADVGHVAEFQLYNGNRGSVPVSMGDRQVLRIRYDPATMRRPRLLRIPIGL